MAFEQCIPGWTVLYSGQVQPMEVPVELVPHVGDLLRTAGWYGVLSLAGEARRAPEADKQRVGSFGADILEARRGGKQLVFAEPVRVPTLGPPVGADALGGWLVEAVGTDRNRARSRSPPPTRIRRREWGCSDCGYWAGRNIRCWRCKKPAE